MGFPVGIIFSGFNILDDPFTSAYAPAGNYPSRLQISRRRGRLGRLDSVNRERSPSFCPDASLGHRGSPGGGRPRWAACYKRLLWELWELFLYPAPFRVSVASA